MPRISQPIASNFDFVVEKRPAFIRLADGNFVETGGFANVRTDTEGVVGLNVSDDYGLIQNADAVAVVESAFQKAGLSTFTRTPRVLRGGSELAVTYDFDRQIQVPSMVGEVLGLRLTLLNSFDGRAPLAFQLGFLRLVCLNGMKAHTRELALTKKHFGNINLDFVNARLHEAVARARTEVELFAAMAKIRITQREGENYMLNLAARGVISAKVAAGVIQIWQNPKHSQDRERNLYNLFNAFTQYNTHVVERDRFEMARRIGGTVTATFANVVMHPSELTPLLLPVPPK